MHSPITASGITMVRRHIETLRLALVSSSLEEIEECLPSLDKAVHTLTSAAQDPPAESRVEIEALRAELHVVTSLLQNGTMLYEGWARLLGAWIAGYVRTGEAAPLTRLMEAPVGGVSAGRISVQG